MQQKVYMLDREMMKVYTIVDLGFGDAGKGTTIDFLSRLTPSTLIVRYNGGPQAAHNVVTADGIHHTFAQFGSGTLVPSVRTYLSKYMWIEPLSLLNENEGLKRKGVNNALSRLIIDMDTPIITPFQKSANKIKETFRKHGSCGMGMGEAVEDSLNGLVLRVSDLSSPLKALDILRKIQEKKAEECKHINILQEETQVLNDIEASEICYELYLHLFNQVDLVEDMKLFDCDQLIFEGAGGVLLDENYGFHPHTMWTTTTTDNVRKLWKGDTTTLGVIRTYSTRHGNGPFVSNNTEKFPEKFNVTNRWQGEFRVGALDLVATKYALKATGGVDALVITHLDESPDKVCDAYGGIGVPFYNGELLLPSKGDLNRQEKLTQALTKCTPHLVDFGGAEDIANRLNLPIKIKSFGAKSNEKEIN
jgi:adenylosuccinate synthase